MSSIEEILRKLNNERFQKLLKETIQEQEKLDDYEKQRQFMTNKWKLYENNFNYNSVIVNSGGKNQSVVCNFGGCLEFGKQDGNDRYLTIPYNTDFNIGENDFTVEWFQYQISISEYPRIFSFGPWESPFSVSIEGYDFYFWCGDTNLHTVISNNLNRWVYFAISRVNGITMIYQDGQRILESDEPYSIIIPEGTGMTIGVDPEYLDTTYFTGGITNLHIINGTGLYNTETISIPTQSIQRNANSILLLSVANESLFITDSSGTDKILTNSDEPVVWNPSNPCGDFSNLIPYPPPVADFYLKETGDPFVPPYSLSAGDNVTFFNNSEGDDLSFEWTFNGGDPSTSTEANVYVVYNVEGTYDVSLKATNVGGTDTKTVIGAIVVS